MLKVAFAQADSRGAQSAVDMKGEQVITLHTRRPRRIKLRYDPALQLERRIYTAPPSLLCQQLQL